MPPLVPPDLPAGVVGEARDVSRIVALLRGSRSATAGLFTTTGHVVAEP
jgi:hypothetical protein